MTFLSSGETVWHWQLPVSSMAINVAFLTLPDAISSPFSMIAVNGLERQGQKTGFFPAPCHSLLWLWIHPSS